MDDKDRIVSSLFEKCVYLSNHFLSIAEESSSNRDSHAFLLRQFFELYWLVEKCNIWYQRTWNLEGFEDTNTFLISENDKISGLEEFSELHLIFHILDLEGESEIDDRCTSDTGDLGSEVPLSYERGEAHIRFIVEDESPSTDDEYIRTIDGPDILDTIGNIGKRISEKIIRKV